jgi:hypothetical protein
MSQPVFDKVPNIKFCENTFSGFRVFYSYRQTDGAILLGTSPRWELAKNDTADCVGLSLNNKFI